ncbi:hypothetical protein [Curtobacterium sp. PhB115]|uniref:hypothetical protein n=1 Tax=Curtobacterium sp. PhB115 TaxID=2485173 RepID=UPI000F4C5635|nr:hypothetical protein [Curtobacterium sp. PhB115]ROP58686.1 hypothetical protein EDF19_3719 [Curtobacterium sp. PhB115]
MSSTVKEDTVSRDLARLAKRIGLDWNYSVSWALVALLGIPALFWLVPAGLWPMFVVIAATPGPLWRAIVHLRVRRLLRTAAPARRGRLARQSRS